MPIVDRAKFYRVCRSKFGGLTQGFVDGTNFILDGWEQTYSKQTSVPQFAVCLATSYWETGKTMKPIREIGGDAYFTKLYDVQGNNPDRARKMGNKNPGDGIRYNGKGYVQLTWFVNYLKATTRLHELGLLDKSVDFTKYPELVMQPRYALPIMFIGMEEGWFTGKKLDDIVDDEISADLKDEHADAVRSRAIINGKDRAEMIAGFAMVFLEALIASVDQKATTVAPTKPVVVEGEVMASAPPGASAWNKFWSAIADLTHKQGAA